MKIAIVGSGSIGLFYGAKLAASGHDVHFLLRSGLDEAERDGIRVFSEDGELHLHPVNAHASTVTIGACDLVIIALKTTQNAALPSLIPPLLGANTLLLTLQNGLGSDEQLAAAFGAERVLGALCFVCLTRRTPAQVDYLGHGTISIGEFERRPASGTRAVADAFRHAGIETHVVDDLASERWKKLVWNIPFNGLSVAEGGVPVDRLLADPRTHDEIRALMEETIAIATALGHSIDPGLVEFHLERTYRMGAYQPSTMVDYLAGRELEIDAIWGEPFRRAQEARVSAPHLERLHTRLLERAKMPA